VTAAESVAAVLRRRGAVHAASHAAQ